MDSEHHPMVSYPYPLTLLSGSSTCSSPIADYASAMLPVESGRAGWQRVAVGEGEVRKANILEPLPPGTRSLL